MQFWFQIANAGRERYLKSFCFGTNISSPTPGSSFANYSQPRGLETFEPCSIGEFAAYGLWFQRKNVPWVESVEVKHVSKTANGFEITLNDGELVIANNVVLATGLSNFAFIPPELASLPSTLAIHTSRIEAFAPFKGRSVAIVGAGQSALEAAALLHEAGAQPQLMVRDNAILWQTRTLQNRSLLRRLRSPLAALGTGPRAWALSRFPGFAHHLPLAWRIFFLKNYLPPEGAWWLRDRVEDILPVLFETIIVEARELAGRVGLRVRAANDQRDRYMTVDHVIAGTGYDINLQRMTLLDQNLRTAIQCQGSALKLSSTFETAVRRLRIIGPASAMSFGPLFRFVAGAEYTANIVSSHLASQTSVPT